MISTTEKEELKNKLEAERLRLEKSLEGFADRDPADKLNWKTRYPSLDDSGAKRDDPSEENADEVEEYDALLETEETLEAILRDVLRALEKIDGDSYGLCEKCNEPIPPERLRANPAARFDIRHAE